jgi:hypothetical protein
MDAFTHLSVVFSIVLGLGVTSLLSGLARIVQLRGDVRVYWPALCWAGILLVVHMQMWWTTFGLRNVPNWTFPVFAITLLQPIMLFFISVLMLPDFDREQDLDIRSDYFRNAPWFFGALGALLVVSLARTYITFGHLPEALDTLFHFAFMLGASACAIFRNELLHKGGAVVAMLAVVAYVGTLFMALR